MMNQKHTAKLPDQPEGADAANPFASMARASALGVRLAGSALELWMGTVASAMEASQRLFAQSRSASGGSGPSVSKPGEQVPGAAIVERKQKRDRQPPAERANTASARPLNARRTKPAPRFFDTHREPAKPAAKRLPSPDDLKVISGIGPKLEQVLNGMGVRRFADIAAWTPDDIAKIEAKLGFPGRIGRDEWIRQAAALAKKNGTA